MAQFLNNLMTASIHGSIVILAVILLRLFLRKTPKKYICLLWLLSGIRLLLPIEIRSDLSLQPEFVLPDWNLPGFLPWVWGAVAICFGIYSISSYCKLKNKVREAVRVRGGWESDRIDTAFILGFIKPRIYIPMGMNRQARKHILAHERTHLDKGDHWIKMIGFLALALHWFNPLVWIAYILLCKDIEMACDERVVQFMELEERKSYSAALLSCSGRQMHLSANPVAFGEVSVKQRILSILKYKKPSFFMGLLGVLAFCFVAICLVTSPNREPDTVVVQVPAEGYAENTPDEIKDTVSRIEKALDAVLKQDRYHLFFMDRLYEGGVGWQANVYKDGKNTLWVSHDSTQEGRMVLDGVSYKFIDGGDGGWVPYQDNDTMLDSLLEEFSLNGKILTDIVTQTRTNDDGYTTEEVSFNTHFTNEAGETVTQPMKIFFDESGNMTGMQVENCSRKGADIFSFSNWSLDSGFNDPDDAWNRAKENIIPIENVHPSKLQEPTLDDQKMKEWGIQFRVDDDLLTQYGSEVWFCQSDGYNMTVRTDNEYWLERRTETGWEKLEMLAEPQWADANYTLGHGMYTMTFVDWSELYGPLPGGTYRMGKEFEKMENGSQSCVGYAEFVIHHNNTATGDQTEALERCYRELEELTQRDHLHWLSVMGRDSQFEHWINGEDYLQITQWAGPDVPYEEWDDFDKSLFPRTDTSVRYHGIGYQDARKDPEVLSSEVIGMKLSTLSADFAGWDRSGLEDDFNYLFFSRGNHTITFPEGVGVISDKMVRFMTGWELDGNMEYNAQLTYQFDDNGDLCYMEYKTEHEPGNVHISSIRIYDDTAEEIDAKIKPYTENLVVADFSWQEAQAKYTDEEFNIRQDSFVNTGGTLVTGPVEAAQLALKEYPNLRDYMSLDIFRDKTSGMWKVTIKGEVEVQSTYDYRDVYLSDSGATQLLVYEGPIGWDETRK